MNIRDKIAFHWREIVYAMHPVGAGKSWTAVAVLSVNDDPEGQWITFNDPVDTGLIESRRAVAARLRLAADLIESGCVPPLGRKLNG